MIKKKHPKILYWFWNENTLINKQYLKDLDRIKEKSDFDLVFLTERNNVDFYDQETLHDTFAEMVEYAHQLGIKIGIQLWPYPKFDTKAYPHLKHDLNPDEAIAVLVEKEIALTGEELVYIGKTKDVRYEPPIFSDLYKVFVFDKVAVGVYREDSKKDITQQVEVMEQTEGTVTIKIKADAALKGKTAYILTRHYHLYGDMFGGVNIYNFKGTLDAYKDIPFDAVGLDEYKYMPLDHQKPLDAKEEDCMRNRFISKGMVEYEEENFDMSYEQLMFDMRYHPQGKESVRIKAINTYFDLMRQGPLKVEEWFYDYSKKVFGEDTFIGVHNTYHNNLTGDEVWATAINWWSIKRDYAQTDECISYPVRMGSIYANQEPIVYDMYYTSEKNKFYNKAIEDVVYNSRVHYHAYNDQDGWGVNLSDVDWLNMITMIEKKITELDKLGLSAPKSDLLIVFGFRSLTNWFPHYDSRNQYDVNNSLFIQEKSEEIWQAGYACALVPDVLIEEGKLSYEGKKAILNGHEFEHVLFLYPQYAKDSSFDFINGLKNNGGNIQVVGEITHNFYGQPRSLEGTYDVFDLSLLEESGVPRERVDDIGILEDGTILMVDKETCYNNEYVTKTYKDFTIRFNGMVGFKVDEFGDLMAVTKELCEYIAKGDKILFKRLERK